ncbi:phage portal protein [Glutamicibacter sp. NPDC087661]|uniref:phage portal protein n=1 Tax=Glutamicibacter sp. NPDC087661 TaxID=3363996 RepID=UPI003811557B
MGFFNLWGAPKQSGLLATLDDDSTLIAEQYLSPWSDSSHLEQITWEALYPNTSADNAPLTRSSAMQIASVAKATQILKSIIARQPLIATDKSGTPLKTQPTFLKQITQGTPNYILLSAVIDDLIFYGRSYLLITERDKRGYPLHARFIPKDAQEHDEHGQLIKAFDKPVKPTDFIRIDANHSGILSYGREVLREAQDLERAAREASLNPIPSLILKNQKGELGPAEVQELLASWNAARRKRGGSVAYINSSLEVEEMGAHIQEQLLIEGRNQVALQVARIFGLPASALDVSVPGASMNYINRSARNSELLDAVAPYQVAVEEHLSLFLPNGQSARFDASGLLLEEPGSRYQAYATAINAGVLTPNEARQKEHLEPLPEPQEPPNEQA